MLAGLKPFAELRALPKCWRERRRERQAGGGGRKSDTGHGDKSKRSMLQFGFLDVL